MSAQGCKPLVCCGLIVSVMLATQVPLEAGPHKYSNAEALPSRRADKLQKHDRSRLSEARAQGKTDVTLLIASISGGNEAVAREVAKVDGTIRYRADDISYLRVVVPTETVEQLTKSSNVEVVSLDGYPDYYSNAPVDSSTGNDESDSQRNIVDLTPAPDRDTPAENPYLPTKDIGAPQFVKAHPTFDGRGVTIAIVEDLPDLLSPELQTATTIDGKPVPKIVEIDNSIDPLDDDIFRVNMSEEVSASDDGHFSRNQVIYTTPANGPYRFGVFDASPRPATDLPFPYTYFSYFDRVNFSDNPSSRGRLFPVLWDERKNTVWVDTNQNNNFTDDKAMTDYNVRPDVNIFGKDNPATAVRDTLGFVVFTNRDRKSVTIGLGSNSHTSGVASAAAGRKFFGGNMSGAAPEAQLVIVKTEGTKNYSPIEGMILAMRNPRVDIATISWGLVMRQNDGNNIVDVVFDRLIERYKKPIVTGIQNGGPAINTAFDCTGKAIIVGGSIHRDTWRTNYGLIGGKTEYVSNLASRGPREDGAFKPDILAPIDSVLVGNGLFPSFTAGRAFKLPPGYQQTLGTSFSGPMAAGGTALLISAAKQSNVAYDSERLKWAIKAGARFLPEFGAHEQGAGVMNVSAAWESLKRAPMPIKIKNSAPVNTILSRYLKEPNRGQGIYEREGWTAGQTGERVITFTRISGLSRTLRYGLTWTGNDGTFSSAQTIRLPLNRPVSIPIMISPKTNGVHSAILSLTDARTLSPIYQTMNTIVAAEQFTTHNRFTITHQGQADFLSWKSYFIHVPAGTQAFKVDLTVSYGNVKLNFFDPSGTSYFTSHPRTPGKGLVQYQEGGSWSRAFPNPEPGVWEVVIINENTNKEGIRLKAQPPATFDFNGQVFGVDIQFEPVVRPDEGAVQKSTLDLKNLMAPFKGHVPETSLGSAFSDRPVLTSNGHPKIYDIDVLPKTTILNVRIGSPSDAQADLDLYVYDCSGEKCIVTEHSVGSGADEAVTINNPTAGRWKVVIDPFSVPSGRTSCEYLDVFTNSRFGLLSPSRAEANHDGGDRWSEEISAQLGERLVGSRYLVSVLSIQANNVDSVDYRISGPTTIRPVALGILVRKLDFKP
jgi:hypothetical protein